MPCDDRRRSIGDAPSGAQSASSSDWGVSEMRRLALFCGGGLVCTGDASSVLAETRVGGSSRFFGLRFVLATRAALGGVGGFLLLGAGLPPVALYLAVAVACVAGALVMAFRVPDVELPALKRPRA